MAFSREHIAENELWRLLTGHFLHTNGHHLLLNLLGISLLWALHGRYFTTVYYAALLLYFGLFCSLAIYLFSPTLYWYVGLSGILHGLFTLGAYCDIRQKFSSGWLLLLGVSTKVAYEQWYGPSEDVAALIGANVAIDAHLYGWLSGMLCIPLFAYFARKKPIKGSD